MSRNGILLGVLLAAGALGAQGCMVAAVGAAAAGTVAYVRGDLQVVEAAKIDKVYEASLEAMEQLEIPVISKSKDALSATITGRDAADKKVVVQLKATPEGPTEISIRIGTFGSETKSRMIYGKIRDNL